MNLKKYLGLGAACAIAVAGMTGVGASAALAAPTDELSLEAGAPSAIDTAAWQAEMLESINAERAAQGVGAVELSDDAGALAQARAEQSAAAGAPIADDAYASQLPAGVVALGENTAASAESSAASFLAQWTGSAEDSAVLADPAADSAGVGIAEGADGAWYAVQIFTGSDEPVAEEPTTEEPVAEESADAAPEQVEDQSTTSGEGYGDAAETPGPESAQEAPQSSAAPFAAAAPLASSSWNQDLLNRVNGLRAQSGAGNLNLSADMNGVAQAWAEQMAANRSMTHNPNYASQIPAGARGHSENIAWNTYSSSAEVFFTQWVNSAPHLAAMTDGRFDNVGFGMAQGPDGWYAVQVFGEYGYALDGGSAEQPPAEEPPAEEPPAEEPPAEEPPAEEQPADEPPAEEPPAEEQPADEPVEQPVDDPVEDEQEQNLVNDPADEPEEQPVAAPAPEVDLPKQVDASLLAAGIDVQLSGFHGIPVVSASLSSGGEELNSKQVQIAEDGSGSLLVQAYQGAEQSPVPAGTEFQLTIEGDGLDEPFTQTFTATGDTADTAQPAPDDRNSGGDGGDDRGSVVQTVSTTDAAVNAPQLANTGAADTLLYGAAAALIALGGMALMLGGRRRA